MYMRLWWKDARQLWTIWVFVALAAAAGQWVALTYNSPQSRHGMLVFMALIWTGFYALAAGAAAFAGEREAGTLRLLDILPASRPVVWAGKFSFALITTLALAALVLPMAAMSTDYWGSFSEGLPLPPLMEVFYGLVVLVALTWGLFWSSILSNALTAALAAVVSTAISMIFVLANIDVAYRGHGFDPYPFVIFELGVILATLIASNIVFTRSSRRLLPFQFQSPIVMTPADPERPRRGRLQTAIAPILATVPRAAEATKVDQSPRRSRLAEARALIWETRHEGATTWWLLAVIGLAVPLPFYFSMGHLDLRFMMVLDIIIALVAGINVFGMENRGRTQRFLTHHGARPGLVWLVKLAVWCVGLAAIWGPHIIMGNSPEIGLSDVTRDQALGAVMMVLLGFAVALLCGMTIARGLTAAVIAMVITLALALPLSALAFAHLLPVPGTLVIPVALLFVSRAWSGDWLLDRPAPGRWLRLGLLLTGTFAVLLGIYTGYRAWSVPDVGPIAMPRAWIVAQPDLLRADLDMRNRDGTAIVRQTLRSLKSTYPGLDLNDDAVVLVRLAVARPDSSGKVLLNDLARLVIVDARKRLEHGDLAGAWSDLINVLRMVRHESDGATIPPAMNALITEREALDLAVEWAIAPRQTAEQLRSALAAIRDLPKMTPADEVLRAQANLTEKTIDLPAKKLEKELESLNGPGMERTGEFWTAAWLDWLTTPWERARARRVNRLLATEAIQKAMLEPWQRRGILSKSPSAPKADLPYELASTPLAKLLFTDLNPYLDSNDWNEVGRQALVQVLAIRAWQLRHNGQFPDSLDKLVPEELPSLPIDPYSGRIFGYVRSGGQSRFSLGHVLSRVGAANKVQTKGYWLLYSDERDNHDDDDAALSTTGTVRATQSFDIVFPIPPIQSGSGVDKKP
jgi:hypothetical protein